MMRAGISRRLGLFAAIGVLFVLAAGGGMANAAGHYQLDAELSLTGGCSVPHPELDPLPDPGCPDPPHPPQPFSWPRAVTVDFKGNIYVASYGTVGNGSAGRVDVFDSDGFFITEISVTSGPQSLAVDSEGNLYVGSFQDPRIVRYEPSVYGPEPDDVAYGNAPVTVAESPTFSVIGLAINKANDHLFADFGPWVQEWGPGKESNPPLPDPIPKGGPLNAGYGTIEIDNQRGRIYVNDVGSGPGAGPVVKVFELAVPHALLKTIDGSTVPGGKFSSADISLAVDEGTGHLFVYDGSIGKVFELTETGAFVGLIEHGFQTNAPMDLVVDNGPESPNGVLNPINPEGRYLFVPSHPSGVGHSFAFVGGGESAPEVESLSFDNVTDEEAELRAIINPGKLSTEYTFKYTTEAQYNAETEKFETATVAGSGTLSAADTGQLANAGVSGLTPETQYHFQVVAKNELGEDKAEGVFTTYPVESPVPLCPNDPLRTGLSAVLSDCRAYELVTPVDTNARSPMGLGAGVPTMNASPDGSKVSFKIEGGSFGGTDATGSLLGDPYLASRSDSGWTTSYAGPTGSETTEDVPIAVSPDQGYVFWNTGSSGSAVVGGLSTGYVRYPDGHSELVGRGSLGTEPRALGRLISADGGHIIFETGGLSTSPPPVPKQLEPNAPPDGTRALYDRTPDGVTHVVSLLPGDEPLQAGDTPTYSGASLDGKGVAFSLDGTLYLRYENDETFTIGDGVTFAGVAEGGNRIFYLEGGKIKRFDAETGKFTDFNDSGTAVPVNVSADGNAAYFVSTSVLTAAPNPSGDLAEVGQQNLYLSRGGETKFVGILTKRDVEGEDNTSEIVGGLGLWVRAVGPEGGAPGRYGIDPSRTTPDGGGLLFESRANLTGYDPKGKAQVYLYDSEDPSLRCISCPPAGAPAVGDASLQTLRLAAFFPEPINSFARVQNLPLNGRRAFFQTPEPLVPRDTDGLQDIYEWEAQGTGSCARPDGCIYLISSPHSDQTEYLYAVSDSGNDVFFRSADLLTSSDTDETPSIYDARVGGGFPPAASDSCPIGQSCPEVIPPVPSLPAPASQITGPSGNVTSTKVCPKGKRKVKRQGKVRCVKKKSSKKQRRKAGTENKGGKR